MRSQGIWGLGAFVLLAVACSDGSTDLPSAGQTTESVTASSACSGLEFDAPWAMAGHCANHSRRSAVSGAQTATFNWSFKAGLLGSIRSSPTIGSDGTVYFGSNDGKVYALSATGQKKWSYQTLGLVQSSPALDSKGILYVGSTDHRLYALSQDTGALVFSLDLQGDVKSSPAVGPDRTVYVGSDRKLFAVKPSGQVLWSTDLFGAVQSSPALSADGATVFAGSNGLRVNALDAKTGALRWKYTGLGSFESSPAVGADGTVYIGCDDLNLYALNGSTGALKWRAGLGGLVQSSPAIGPDGTVYAGSTDGRLYALDPATGARRFRSYLNGFVVSSPSVDADGRVYVGSDDGRLYALDGKTGQTLWSYRTGLLVRSSPAIGRFGTIYVGSDDANLYSIGEAPTGFVDATHTAVGMCGNNQRAPGSTTSVCLGARATGVASVLFTVNGKQVTAPNDCVSVSVSRSVEIRAFQLDASGADVTSNVVFLTTTDNPNHCPVHRNVVLGTRGDDVLRGTQLDDYISGGPGDDYIVPHGGYADDLLGGDGADTFDFTEVFPAASSGAGAVRALGGPPGPPLAGWTADPSSGDTVLAPVDQTTFNSSGLTGGPVTSGYQQVSSGYERTLGASIAGDHLQDPEDVVLGSQILALAPTKDGGFVSLTREGSGPRASAPPYKTVTTGTPVLYAARGIEKWDANGHLAKRILLRRPAHFLTSIVEQRDGTGTVQGYVGVGYTDSGFGFGGGTLDDNDCLRSGASCQDKSGFVVLYDAQLKNYDAFYFDGSAEDASGQRLNQGAPLHLYDVVPGASPKEFVVVGVAHGGYYSYQSGPGAWTLGQPTVLDYDFAMKLQVEPRVVTAKWRRVFMPNAFSPSNQRPQRLNTVTRAPVSPVLRVNEVGAVTPQGYLAAGIGDGQVSALFIGERGDYVWASTYGEGEALGVDSWVQCEPDRPDDCVHGYVLGGESNAYSLPAGSKRFGAFLVKLGSDGRSLWLRQNAGEASGFNVPSGWRFFGGYAKAKAKALVVPHDELSTGSSSRPRASGIVIGGNINQPWSTALYDPSFTPIPLDQTKIFGEEVNRVQGVFGFLAEVDMDGNLVWATSQGPETITSQVYDSGIHGLVIGQGAGIVAGGYSTSCPNEPGLGPTDPVCMKALVTGYAQPPGSLNGWFQNPALYKVAETGARPLCGPGICDPANGGGVDHGVQCDCTYCGGPIVGLCSEATQCSSTSCAEGLGCATSVSACSPPDGCSVNGRCDPNGTCAFDQKTCVPPDACSTNGRCEAGQCKFDTLPCPPPDGCSLNGRCENGACRFDAKQCDAPDACKTNARCEGGDCKFDDVVCPVPADECQAAACDPVTGCGTTNKKNGTPCGTNQICKSGVCSTPTYVADVQPILMDRCTPCHQDTGGTCSGSACLASSYADATSTSATPHCPNGRAQCIYDRTKANQMPQGCTPGSTCLSQPLLDIIYAWWKSGAPQ